MPVDPLRERRLIRTVRTAVMLAGMVALCSAVACGGGGGGGTDDEAPAVSRAPVANPVDQATAGSITGTVTFDGVSPPARTINTGTDPRCTSPVTTEDVVVGSGKALQNVFIYVKDGLGTLSFPVPETAVVLAQEGCVYKPHVLGIQVGQTLAIVSGDDTLHNIHAIPERNGEFNMAQQAKGARNTHIFNTSEVMVPFKCDVHKWMTAYVGVVEHPFFAVTGQDGTFTLKGLPPGTYTVEAVHEKLGRQTQSVTLTAKGTQDIAFAYKT